MRLKKEDLLALDGGDYKPPWSEDPLMANVRYCNVHREDDKVTRWIRDNWRNPNATDKHLTLAMTCARMVNWPDSLEEIDYPWDDYDGWAERAKNVMRKRQKEGKAWSSAYIISTCGRAMPKEDYVFNHVLPQVRTFFTNWYPAGTFGIPLRMAHGQLQKVDGLGSFLAAQVIADLKNTPGHVLEHAPDWWTWSAPGPGSLKGLEYFWGRKVSPGKYEIEAENCWKATKDLIHPYVGKIHMQDFQNCLCEFSKYMRVKNGGWARNRYPAAAG